MLRLPLEALRGELEANAPFLLEHPRLSLAAAGGAGLAGAYFYRRWRRTQGLDRAATLTSEVGSPGRGRGCWGVGDSSVGARPVQACGTQTQN